MLKVAILDDYQNVAQEFIDLKNLSSKFDIEIFSQPFENEDDAIKKLKDKHGVISQKKIEDIKGWFIKLFNYSGLIESV